MHEKRVIDNPKVSLEMTLLNKYVRIPKKKVIRNTKKTDSDLDLGRETARRDWNRESKKGTVRKRVIFYCTYILYCHRNFHLFIPHILSTDESTKDLLGCCKILLLNGKSEILRTYGK